MTKSQKETAERLAELLVTAPVEEGLKELIVNNVDKLPESMVLDLLDALETGNDQLEALTAKVEAYIDAQDIGWQEVEKEQGSYAEKFLEGMAQTLDDEARIQELKDSL